MTRTMSRTEALCQQVELIGFVVDETTAPQLTHRSFVVRSYRNLEPVGASFEVDGDGVFRFGTVQGRDVLSWPEFLDAMKAVKK